VRKEARIAGNFLFPSTRTGKQWLRDSQYQCAKRVLEEAGVDSREGGSFRLRHTFALRQLKRGAEPEAVARWLGVEPQEMKRERVMTAAADVV
jgi:site-specific recombinase XerD